MEKIRKILSLAALAVPLLAAFPSYADKHSDGLTFGKGQLSTSNKKPNPSDVPLYNPNPAQASSYSGGNPFDLGVGRINTCKTYQNGSDKVANQECSAVNFLAKNPETRKRFDINPHDPIITVNRDIMTNATDGTTSDGECVQRTSSLPDEHKTEVCNEQLTISAQTCTMGQIVKVDGDSNFRCDVTYKALEQFSCSRGVSVSVGFGSCSPGAWLGRVAYVDCSYCYDPYFAANIYCGSNGVSYDVQPYRSYDGVHVYDYHQIGYNWDGIYGTFHVPVAPGVSVIDYYISNFGFGCNLYCYYSVSCSATACTPGIRNVSYGCNSSGGSAWGSPLALPMQKTFSTWTSNECSALQQRSQ